MFASLDYIGESHVFIRPKNKLKRLLFEMMLHSCIADIKEAGNHLFILKLFVLPLCTFNSFTTKFI